MKNTSKNYFRRLCSIALSLLLLLQGMGVATPVALAETASGLDVPEEYFNTSGNMALNRPVVVSGTHSQTDHLAPDMVDGDATTRWAGVRYTDTNWAVVDLGSVMRLDTVYILWEAAYSSEYTIDVSDDGTTWKTVSTVNSDGGADQTALPESTTGRYLRIQGVKAAKHQYGMSIYELEVYGEMELEGDMTALAADLRQQAAQTLEELETQNQVVYVRDNAEALAFENARQAALTLLEGNNYTYAELATAQQTLDVARNALKIVGHTLMTFANCNRDQTYTRNSMYNNGQDFYVDWHGATEGATDLSQYDRSKLVLRCNLTFDVYEEAPADTPVPDSVTIVTKNGPNSLALREYVEGKAVAAYAAGYTIEGLRWGEENLIEIPLSSLTGTTGDMPWTGVKDLFWYFTVQELEGLGVDDNLDNWQGNYVAKIRNACIVDTSAEDNIGSVDVVGNGRAAITGGLGYGTDDTVAAVTDAETSRFVGFRVNDTFSQESTRTLPVTGNQQVTAYFADQDEVVTVFYGQQNRVVDVKVFTKGDIITEGDLPTAPALRNGRAFISWGDIDALNAAVNTSENGYASCMAIYDAAAYEKEYTITVTNATLTNIDAGETVAFNQRVEARAQDNQVAYWLLDGKKVGYGQTTYTFYACGNHTIQAVAGTEALEAATIVIPTTMTEQQADGRSTWSLITVTNLPENAEILEYGVLFAPNEDTLTKVEANDDTVVEGKDYIRVISSENTPNVQHKFELRSVPSGATRYGMGYLIVRQEGIVQDIVYSAVEMM